jgi:putative DNA primase/helicase
MSTVPSTRLEYNRRKVLKNRNHGEAGALRPKLNLVSPKPNPKRAINKNRNDWPEPRELGGGLPPVPAFNPELLPPQMKQFVEDIANRMQVPLDFPAVTAVATIAGLTGRRLQIQPKAEDDGWLVVPNLWGILVGLPGTIKSHVIVEITALARSIEAEFRAAAGAAGHSKRRLLTSDATFESLHELLSTNPGGIFVLRDELSGWLASLERQGRETERAFFLESWEGNSSFTMDRIGRGTVHVEHCCVSLFGGIQPDRLRGYLAKVLRGDVDNDGLIQRFQLLVWPDVQPEFTYQDRKPDERWRLRFEEFCRGITRRNAVKPKILRFAPGAQEFFADWFTKLEIKLRNGSLSPAMQGHLGKYRSLMPSLALLLSIFDNGLIPVELEYVQQAADWCEYLQAHANRVYGSVKNRKETAAKEFARHLQDGWKRTEGAFTLRDVYRNQWAGLSTKEEAATALQVLEDANWIKHVRVESPTGRPKQLYTINPKLRSGDPTK